MYKRIIFGIIIYINIICDAISNEKPMLIKRPFWENLIEESWKQKNVIWLKGVSRSGKTCLCKTLKEVEYFDCRIPRIRSLLEDDPEGFLDSQKGKRIALDDIHRLRNPSEILKLAADYYPTIRIIATGSSTLGASAKFSDTLTGRKREIWLTPLLLEELNNFCNEDIRHRFLFGGFPSFFCQKQLPEQEFSEWIDAYWAKDIQELFKVEKRYSFQKFAELLFVHSGGLFEATKFAAPSEVSRQTIMTYLGILEETFVVHVIRPYSSYRSNEIVMAPKIYGLDTGFICYAKGWRELRKEDTGLLWEQCVLNEIHGKLQTRAIRYWRSKKGHELDFVIPTRGDNSISAIECKFSCLSGNLGESMITSIGKNIEAFRQNYPHGENFVVAYDIDRSFKRYYHDITLNFVSSKELVERLSQIPIN